MKQMQFMQYYIRKISCQRAPSVLNSRLLNHSGSYARAINYESKLFLRLNGWIAIVIFYT